MRHILKHKTTGYYAVLEDEGKQGFRHSPNESDATPFESFKAAELARREFDSFSGAWMAVEVAA